MSLPLTTLPSLARYTFYTFILAPAIAVPDPICLSPGALHSIKTNDDHCSATHIRYLLWNLIFLFLGLGCMLVVGIPFLIVFVYLFWLMLFHERLKLLLCLSFDTFI